MVSLILSNTNVKIKGNIPKGALQKIDSNMSYYIPGHQFSRNSGNSWDGRVRLLTKNGYFPIGLLSLTEKILKESGIEYEIIDNRPVISYGKQLPIIGDQKPRDYQEDAVNKAFIAGSGIIRSATGSGKALMCAMLAAKYNTDTIIYVVTKDLLYQMYKTVTETLGVECGIIGDGKCDIVKGINICTIWSAASAFGEKFKISDSEVDTDEKDIKKDNSEKLKDLVKNAKVMIVDECQYAASHTVQFLHKNSLSARHRFLLSGTPWRENGDDLLIEAVSGPKFFDLGASDLIRKGILVAPEIHMLRVPPIKNPGKRYAEIYKNYIVTNDERNDLIKSCAKKLVGLKKKTLILISKLEHGKILYESLSKEMNVEYLSGANSTDERKRIIKDLEDGIIDVIIATKIFEVGVDIPQLDALIIASGGKSRGLSLQRIGRAIRGFPGKNKAVIIDFMDSCTYLRDHSTIRVQTYKTEPEFRIKLPTKKK